MKRFRTLLPYIIIMSILLITGWAYSATFTVTNLNDSGDGSLRWAIEQANANPGPDIIDFSVSVTIFPTSALPAITDDETVIDASSQWIGTWPEGQPGITLDGSGAGWVNGLEINSAANCHIRGLFITNFEQRGIMICSGAQNNTIGGTDEGYRNVVSGNNDLNMEIYGFGIEICYPGTNDNKILGNYIGTDVTGTAALGNAKLGVLIQAGAQFNIVERNIISGNNGDGLVLCDEGTGNNKVCGNYIGTDVNGTAILGNSEHGVKIREGVQSNIIGGGTDGERNVISGNGRNGVAISGSGTNSNKVCGNYIGTDVSGTAVLGNAGHGVYIDGGAQFNIIGGTTEGERNIISGNDVAGVSIHASGTNNNVVSGNYIGTDINGTADLGNAVEGVFISNGAQFNIIGGITEGERNIISGNDERGIGIAGSGTNSNKVCGNYIGTDVSGTAALGNSWSGVGIWDGAQASIIGGATNGEKNIISGNNGSGVFIFDSETNGNIVSGNYIGTKVNGTEALGNSNGIVISNEAQSNIIGGTTDGKRNIISANRSIGVNIEGSGTNNNIVLGNYIGTNVSGKCPLGNSYQGINIGGGAQLNTIGGTGSGEGNIIAFNGVEGADGVLVNGTDTDYNKISGNSICCHEGIGIELFEGGNDEIPAPTITSAVLTINTLHVEGTNAGAYATVELFEADSFESGEGMTYLGSLITDENGNFSGKINVRGKELSVGDPLTATTTHTDDNTSEFCPTVAMVGGGWESTYDQMFAREDSLIALPVLRRYRDERLMTDPQGEELVRELYDEHSGELVLILITHPKLARRSSSLVMQHLLGIRRVLDGKQMTMNSSQLAKVEVLLEDVAAVGSPELKEYIRSIQQVLQEGHLANFGIEVRDNVEEAIQIVQKPNEFRLFQNKPNPCNPDTWIPYQLSEAAEVKIRIYNVSGQLVRTLRLGTKPAGFYLTKNRAAHWDGKDSLGQSVASGMYFYNLEAGKFTATRKMLILK